MKRFFSNPKNIEATAELAGKLTAALLTTGAGIAAVNATQSPTPKQAGPASHVVEDYPRSQAPK